MLNDHDAEVPDYLTGLHTRTQYRRPDWKPVFESLKSKHVGQSKITSLYAYMYVRVHFLCVCVRVCWCACGLWVAYTHSIQTA